MVAKARAGLSTAAAVKTIDAVAIGSPHLSNAEFDSLERFIAGRRLAVPIYACTGRHAPRSAGAGWPTKEARGERRGHRCRYLVVVTPTHAGTRQWRADDQLGQVRALRPGQHRLCGALRIASPTASKARSSAGRSSRMSPHERRRRDPGGRARRVKARRWC
ncbi:hypothetical protein ACVOMV_14615 [Mesorhizobium atlanticum]